jgi:hypothetical protein
VTAQDDRHTVAVVGLPVVSVESRAMAIPMGRRMPVPLMARMPLAVVMAMAAGVEAAVVPTAAMTITGLGRHARTGERNTEKGQGKFLVHLSSPWE